MALMSPHAAHLKEVVRVFAPAGKFLDHRQDQAKVAADELLPRRPIPRLAPAQELQRLLVAEHLEPGGIDAADLHFPLHVTTPCQIWRVHASGKVFPREGNFIRQGRGEAGGVFAEFGGALRAAIKAAPTPRLQGCL